MSTIDELYGEVVAAPYQNAATPKSSMTADEVIIAMLTAYARAEKHRESLGVQSTSLSRREYERYRTPDSPHWWDIYESVGSWVQAKKILPTGGHGAKKHNSYKARYARPDLLADVLESAGEHFSVPPHTITRRQLSDYSALHPDSHILDWRVYCKYIAGELDWQKTKTIALLWENY